MIEKTVISYLSQQLSTPVYAERPETPDSTYVIAECTGKSKRNHISSATIAIQCIAPSLLAAAELCDTAANAMEQITDLPDVSKCELNSAYNFTNTATREYRYQAVFDLVYFD